MGAAQTPMAMSHAARRRATGHYQDRFYRSEQTFQQRTSGGTAKIIQPGLLSGIRIRTVDLAAARTPRQNRPIAAARCGRRRREHLRSACMSDGKLKLVETCALLIMMREAQEISNADLKNLRGLELKRENRENLRKLGLIEVREEKRRIHLNLSDKAWNRDVLDVIGTEAPARSGYQGAAIYAQVAALRQFLDASGMALSEYFTQPGEAQREPGQEPVAQRRIHALDEIVALIRKAYDGLAQRPGDAVKLVRLRSELPGIERAQVDEALIALNTEAGVRVFAEANQKTLTDADRAAAVSIGNQDKHLLAIG
ncbi:hypothetical protein COUCH_31045 [Couchioplanes caeruleus]|uniref:hypothetical protein n=1 Tax=Couchioplanes caeruleus TaxID=56438 RepID=UPI0020BDC72A|nr:hypothetical protein [Couchioplanes caeruleus]UQU63413.1 hypothetical protein COUCH_31045 [Couchioplanes caeruleus]